MSSVIVLSSSPLRTFARSPTRVDFSSPQKISQHDAGDVAQHENVTFKPSKGLSREGFSSFTTAKEVLATRSTAENIPITAKSSKKVEVPHSRWMYDAEVRTASSGAARPQTRPLHASKDAHLQPSTHPEPSNHTVVQILPGDTSKKKRVAHIESLNLQKATARRTQWSPIGSGARNSADGLSSNFGLDLVATFGHAKTACEKEHQFDTNEQIPTKRRKLDATTTMTTTHPKLKPQGSAKTTSRPTTKRSKSPVKKNLTITGLATSHYADSPKAETTPMMQYLISTQAMMDADANPETFDIQVKKAGTTRKAKTNSRLRSPKTAMESLDSQEIIFATASQLAREDSPTLLRDTIEAIKLSEQHFHSSPVRSQQTVDCSVQSLTPQKTGLTRFHGRRSLWTAGDRDEQDALLYVDDDPCIADSQGDLFSSIAPKDAALPPQSQENGRDSMNLLATLKPDVFLFDIDDLPDSPPSPPQSAQMAPQRREYSTSAKQSVSKRTTEESQKTTCEPLPQEQSQNATAAETQLFKSLSPKPNYGAWGDDELKEACQNQGIKRLRARKSMIDKLDELWAEKRGIDPKIVKAATKRASKTTKISQTSDFLGKVHGLAERPVPKVKKSRKKKMTADSRTTNRDSGPDDKDHDIGTPFSDVVIVADFSGPTAFDRIADIEVHPDEGDVIPNIDELEPSTAPTKGTGVKAAARKGRRSKQKKAAIEQIDHRLTPPPTLPQATQQSSPAFEVQDKRKKRPAKGAPPSPLPTQHETASVVLEPDDSLRGRIADALSENAKDTTVRNHYENPTWYEKIQMYDPIVLEDFTAWLNTQGFDAVGEDREIDANDVRDWCHENGVTCLWKGGWRGNKKKGRIEE